MLDWDLSYHFSDIDKKFEKKFGPHLCYLIRSEEKCSLSLSLEFLRNISHNINERNLTADEIKPNVKRESTE